MSDPTHDVALPGCTPEPLMGYLKALGVFRLVAEQTDPAAKLSWKGGVARLHTTLARDALTDFFLNDYRPTPILAPWNGGSGFYGGGAEPLEAVARSSADRLAVYRDTITAIRRFIPKGKPKDDQKQSLLARCRADLPDAVVPWLDACFVLGGDGASYFALLGTGANDGRLDFTNNFLQRLADVIPFAAGGKPPSGSDGWLSAALFNDSLAGLRDVAVGQFNPGGIGGANGVQGRFEADSRVNPWDFVLMIEGALLFAGSVARRLGSNAGAKAAFPFTVESVAVGYGSASAGEETTDASRAELWLPLWDDAASLGEVTHLFAEGRAQLGRRQARNSVEFALAVSLLGVSRGATAFTRYGFLKRNGLAFLAAPLGRVAVTPRPEARLLDDPPLTAWVDALRRACRDKERTPARYQSALRGIDRAMFEFANRSEQGRDADRRVLRNVLAALGRAERTLAGGLAFCKEHRLQPLQNLDPRWLLAGRSDRNTRDECRDFRLAAALASISALPGTEVGPIRFHFEPIQWGKTRSWVEWRPGSTSAVWNNRPVVSNLADVLLRRFMECERAGGDGVSLSHRLSAPLGDVLAFLAESADARREASFTDLLWALTGLRWTDDWFRKEETKRELRRIFRAPDPLVVPWEFAMLRLVTESVALVAAGGSYTAAAEGQAPTLRTTPVPEPFHRLVRGVGRSTILTEAVQLARQRLWADQLRFTGMTEPDNKIDSLRLVAACLFPLSSAVKSRLVRSIASVAATVR